MAESKTEQARRRWLEIQDELSPGETELSRTLDNIAVVRAGWHRVRNEAGEWSYFPHTPNHAQGSPEQRQLEDEWEQRALAMHEAQTPVAVDAKPAERARLRSDTGIAAFEVAYADEEPKAFHELSGEDRAAVLNKTTRGT